MQASLPFQLDPPDLQLAGLQGPADLISQMLVGQAAPVLARTARSGRSARYYVGRRPQETEV